MSGTKQAQTVASALCGGRPLKLGNASTDGVSYFLHENKIFSNEPPTPELAVRHRLLGQTPQFWCTFAGWRTPTTARHLSAVTGLSFSLAGGKVRVLEGGEWLEISADRWYSDEDLDDLCIVSAEAKRLAKAVAKQLEPA